MPLFLRAPGFLCPLTEISPWTLVLASGICFDRVLSKRISCYLKSYLVQLGRWTVSRNFSENALIFLPVSTGTEDPLGREALLMGELGEGFEELARFLVGGRDLTSREVKTFEAKGKSSVATPPAITAGQGAPTKGSIA